MDISADLQELARCPVGLVSAGVKSILDIGRYAFHEHMFDFLLLNLLHLQNFGIPCTLRLWTTVPSLFNMNRKLLVFQL